MRTITLGSRGPGNSLHSLWPWQKSMIKLNLWMDIRDEDLSFFMKCLIFLLCCEHTVLFTEKTSYINLSPSLLWPATKSSGFLYARKRRGDKKDLVYSKGIWFFYGAVSIHPLNNTPCQWPTHLTFLPNFFSDILHDEIIKICAFMN